MRGVLFGLAILLATQVWGAEITSALGRTGVAFEAGMTPTTLGWGEDSQPYPDKFVINPKDGAEMVWVPAGEFQMGSSPEEIEWAFGEAQAAIGDQANREWFDDEAPAHAVKLTSGFWMYRCEVTNGQFRSFKRSHNSGVRDRQSLNGDRQPVVRISWRDAKAYCDWAGVKLPSEAQWEYACRAGSTTRYFWGDEGEKVAEYANVPDLSAQRVWPAWKVFEVNDGHAVTAPVGSFKPNAFGLHDMLGNVNEWCADWYAPDYYQNTPEEDPPGPTSGESRVMRGGSWSVQWYDCRSGNRNNRRFDSQYEYLGFRAIRLP
jgi:formylglycine-generating enzyme required for sulfatase activity